jgi:VCBS repeat-containing protein
VTNIAVTNTAGSAGTFTLTLDGTDLFTTAAIAANTTALFDIKQVLAANATPKTIKGGASAITINFHVSGVEVA